MAAGFVRAAGADHAMEAATVAGTVTSIGRDDGRSRRPLWGVEIPAARPREAVAAALVFKADQAASASAGDAGDDAESPRTNEG